MADNLLWALEREGPEGRVVVWAHNTHLQKFPIDHTTRIATVLLHAKFTPLGLFLHSIRGDDYVNIGFAYGQGAQNGWASYQTDASKPAKPGSLDAEFARVGLPMFILDLRSVPKDGPVHEWLNRSWEQRESVPEYFLLNPLQAWDALFYINEISPAQVESRPRSPKASRVQH